MDQPLIIHTMIGNSGGMSFSNALTGSVIPAHAVLYKDSGALTPAEAEQAAYLHGHFPPALVPTIHGRAVANLLLLRSPIRKFISDYNWLRGYYFTGDYRPSNEGCNPPPEVNRANAQPEFMEALGSLDRFADYIAQGHPNEDHSIAMWLRQFLPHELGNIPSGPAFVAAAVAAVRRHYRFIGITEFFEESLFDLCRSLNWPTPAPWVRWGVYNPSIRPEEIGAETVKRIGQAVPDDLAIYAALRADAETRLNDFVFDEEFLRYKAEATVRDARMMDAFLRSDPEYLPRALWRDEHAMDTFRSMVNHSRNNN